MGTLPILRSALSLGKLRHTAIVLLWGVFMASIISYGMFARTFLSVPEVLLIVVASVLAGAVLQDLPRVILGYFVAIVFAVVLTYFLLTLPVSLGVVPDPSGIIYGVWAGGLVRAVFPLQFIAFFMASIFGSLVSERYLSGTVWTRNTRTEGGT